jgi:ABC-type amino acid transport substrate-binding protein
MLFTKMGWANDNVTIAYFQAEPHIFYDASTQKVSGALYTFLEEYIAPKMEVQFVWDTSPSNVPRQIHQLTHELTDAVAILHLTPDRAEKFSYTTHRFYAAKPAIGVLKSSSLTKVDTVEDILHLTIGYAVDTYISPFMRDERITFEFVHTGMVNEQNAKKLKAGRIDAMYIPDKAALLSEMKLLNMEEMIRVIDLPEEAGNVYVVFSKRHKALADKYDKAYNEIHGDTVYQELLSQYLDVNRL